MRPLWLGVCACLAIGFGTPAPVRADAALTERLERALEHSGFHGGRVSALVVRADDGSEVFARGPDEPRVPASNLKLFTALAALDAWGPGHRFTTRVWADRAPGSDGRVGWLAIEGGGDPSLVSEEWWRLADDVRLQGVKQVEGPLVLDDSHFDAHWFHPGWGRPSLRAYHAPVGGLMANHGAFSVHVRPGPLPGAPTPAEIDPPVPLLRLTNAGRTRGAGTPAKLAVDYSGNDAGVEVWTLTGRLPVGAEAHTVWRRVTNPTIYAGAVARMQLEAVGIDVLGGLRRQAVPDGAVSILDFEGQPLARVVYGLLKYSNNTIAEVLCKGIGGLDRGAPGSWRSGPRAVMARLAALGVDMDGVRIIDGSGVSRANRVTTRAVVDVLRIGRDSFRFGPEFVASLPISGTDGTLERRIGSAAARIRAKTGLLDRVTALSGYADTDSGLLVFSIITNGHVRGGWAAMTALDGFAAALVGEP